MSKDTARAGDEVVRQTAERRACATTLRERWLRAMRFQSVDRLPNMEFGYWVETLPEWRQQGLPPEVADEKSAYRYFGIENWRGCGINVDLKPGFKEETVEENGDYRIYRHNSGALARINKVGHKSIPHFFDFPVKDRKTWEAFKERLQPGPDRVPADWPRRVEEYRKRDYPLCVPIGSMIGRPRNWIGFESICLMVHEEPELLEDIVETLCVLVCDTLERVLPDVEFDFGAGWEDICYNQGPIVGYDFMRNVVTPRYKRITDLLHKHGCHVAWTDCDGNIVPILDCFLDGGINCMFPVEVHAGSDPVLMRRKYPQLLMQGGFDKMKLIQGKEAIRAELQRLLPVVEEGGFIPGVDHRVPSNVTLENYKYYMKLKRDMFGAGGEPQYDERGV